MGAISGMLGLGGGASGTGFGGPQMGNVVQTTDPGQIQAAYSGTQNSLQQQQQLLQALQAQNGIGNQSQVYNQLQGVAAGTGPNPAQAMLANSTGQNVSNQAALMAGQRGVGANPGMIARQIGQQGAGIHQNAAGQAAALQAQQSLNAIGAAGNMANTMVGNQMGATNANTAANLSEQGQLLGAQANANNAVVNAQNNVNSVNAGLAGNVMGEQQKLIGGAANALGASGAMGSGIQNSIIAQPKAHGGIIQPMSSFGQKLANGGKVKAMVSPGEIYLNPNQARQVAGDKSKAGQVLSHARKVPGKAAVKGDSYKNDTVKADLDEGGVVVPRSKANMPQDAARFIEAALSKKGKKK